MFISDESPPELTCPNVRIIELETEDSVHQYEKLEMNDVVSFADVGTVKAFSVTGEPNTIKVSDLYRTFTYTVLVTDQSNNAASCKGQIFVRRKLLITFFVIIIVKKCVCTIFSVFHICKYWI